MQKIVIVLIIMGLGILGAGLFLFIQANMELNSEISLAPIRPPINFDSTQYITGNVSNPTIIQFKFIFSTDYEFAVGHPFNYVFQAKVDGPNIIEKVYVFFVTQNLKPTEITQENVFDTIEHFTRNQEIVELKKIGLVDDGTTLFEREGSFLYPLEEEVSLYPITIASDNTFLPIEVYRNLFDIKPAAAWLEAKGNQDQIISIKKQDLTNKSNTGLTAIFGSLAVFGLAVPIHYRGKKSVTQIEVPSEYDKDQPPLIFNSQVDISWKKENDEWVSTFKGTVMNHGKTAVREITFLYNFTSHNISQLEKLSGSLKKEAIFLTMISGSLPPNHSQGIEFPLKSYESKSKLDLGIIKPTPEINFEIQFWLEYIYHDSKVETITSMLYNGKSLAVASIYTPADIEKSRKVSDNI